MGYRINVFLSCYRVYIAIAFLNTLSLFPKEILFGIIWDNLFIFIRHFRKKSKLVSLYAGVSGQLDHSKLTHHFRYTLYRLIFGTSTRRHDSKSLTTIKKHKRHWDCGNIRLPRPMTRSTLLYSTNEICPYFSHISKFNFYTYENLWKDTRIPKCRHNLFEYCIN